MEIKENKKTLFLIHQHADPDAVGSSYFLSQIFSGDVASPTPPSRLGKTLSSFLDLDVQRTVDFKNYEQIVVLDTSNPSQLEPLVIPKDKDITLVIDHHLSNSWEDDIELHFEDRTSCSEIVYDMVKKEDLTEKEGIALISGILTDTSFLKRGDSRTFLSLGEILEKSGVSIQAVKGVLYESRSYSEKIARLKGGKRSSFTEVDGVIIAHTEIGAFEGSVTSYLLKGGADIAFCLNRSKKKNALRISGRASEKLVKKGMDVGKIFTDLSKKRKNMDGGGHPGAAVLSVSNLSKENDHYVNLCLDRIISTVKEKGLSQRKR